MIQRASMRLSVLTTNLNCCWLLLLLVVGCCLLALLKTCKFTTTQRNPNQTNFQEEKQKEGRRIILPARKQTKHYDSLFRNMIVLKHWCEDTINLVYFTYAKHPYVVYKNKNKSNNWRPASMLARRSEEEQTELASCHPWESVEHMALLVVIASQLLASIVWCARRKKGQNWIWMYHAIFVHSGRRRDYIERWRRNIQERPYNHDSTASRLLSEVKHDLARLVLRWGTTLESLVLFFYFYLLLSLLSQEYSTCSTRTCTGTGTGTTTTTTPQQYSYSYSTAVVVVF